MEAFTIFIWGMVIAFLWWLFARGSSRKSSKTTVTYTDASTGEEKKEVKKARQPQDRVSLEKPTDFEINSEIKEVLDILENSNQNVFLTGKAGTGKSTLLRYFRATTNKYPVVVAPTGVAAVNVQGQTIHSFFGWGIDVTPEKVRRVSYERSQIYRKMRMLIIDEISMVRADLYECIDRFLRLNTGQPEKPFGGVQVVVIGDLYQLPPVVTTQEKRYFEQVYKSPFFFSTEAFSKANFRKFELNTVYRQKDQMFVSALNAIREGVASPEHIDLLNESVIQNEPKDFDEYVHLVTTNKMAKEINDARMSRLPDKPVTYKGSMFGTFTEKNAPTDPELSLKRGAQVMLLNNDRERRWVNGDVVKVVQTKTESIVVEFDDESVQEVIPHTWETVRFVFDEEEQKIIPKKIGGFTQIPAKPAWAMTIHKAQGKTFEKVFIDLGSGAFAAGQTYVALSRCKSLQGLKLATPLVLDDVFVNEQVREFMSFAHGETQTRPVAVERQTTQGRPSLRSRNSPAPLTQTRPNPSDAKKLSHQEFTLQAIKKLRTGDYKGIHVVYSGFNKAFRDYFGSDPVEAVKKLEEKGVVVTHPVRGGVMLYDARESQRPAQNRSRSRDPLSTILGDE